jgi:hypothetical protein
LKGGGLQKWDKPRRIEATIFSYINNNYECEKRIGRQMFFVYSGNTVATIDKIGQGVSIAET